MNIISYNVRDLGRGVKWGAIRRLIKQEGVSPLYGAAAVLDGERPKSDFFWHFLCRE